MLMRSGSVTEDGGASSSLIGILVDGIWEKGYRYGYIRWYQCSLLNRRWEYSRYWDI